MAQTTYSDEVLDDSPYLYWKMDETSGTTVDDSSGNNRDGTYVNSPTLNQTSLINEGKSVDFDGSNDRIDYTLPANFTGSFTIELWFECDDVTKYNNLFGAWTANSNGNYGTNIQITDSGTLDINIARTDFNFWLVNAGGYGPISANTRYHLALVANASTNEARLYINGSQSGSTMTWSTSDPVIGASGKTFRVAQVGSVTNSNTFDGQIQNFAIYSSALSGARILAHYNAGKDKDIDAVKTDIDIAGKNATVTATAPNATINAVVTDIDILGKAATVTGEANISVTSTDININEETHVVIAGVTITINPVVTDIDILGHSPIISVGGSVTIPQDNDESHILLQGKDAAISTSAFITVVKTNINIDGKDINNLYPSLVLSKNPVHYYRFIEQNDPTEIKDYGSVPYDGTTTNIDASDYVNGIPGDPTSESVVFNGSTSGGTEGVNFYPNKILDITASDITLEFWIKTSSENLPIFSVDKPNTTLVGLLYGGQTSENWRYIGLRAGYLSITYRVSVQSPNEIRGQLTDSYLSDNRWHHVVLTKKTVGSTITYNSFVDGQQTNIALSLATLTDGSHGTQSMMAVNDDSLNFIQLYNYEASLDEFAIYNFAFSSQDISDHFASGGGVLDSSVSVTTSNIDIEGKSGIVLSTTVNADRARLTIRSNVPLLSAGGNIIVGSTAPNISIESIIPVLSVNGSISIPAYKRNIGITGKFNQVVTKDADFIFIPTSDTNISTADAEELESLDFGGLLYNQNKNLSFKIGNTRDVVCNFNISIISVESSVLPAVLISYDKINYYNTLSIEGIAANSISDPIYINFDVNKINLLGAGTFLINVEQINVE